MEARATSKTESFVTMSVAPGLVGLTCEDVAAVAAACLLDPEKHKGQAYRLGYEARRIISVRRARADESERYEQEQGEDS